MGGIMSVSSLLHHRFLRLSLCENLGQVFVYSLECYSFMMGFEPWEYEYLNSVLLFILSKTF